MCYNVPGVLFSNYSFVSIILKTTVPMYLCYCLVGL